MRARDTQAPDGQAWPIIVIASIAAVLAYTSWVFLGRPDPSQADLASSLLLIALTLFAAGASLSLARDTALSSRLRRAWLLFALANVANAAAEVLWMSYSLRGIDPFPSAADFFYLLYYPLFLAGTLSGGEQQMLAVARGLMAEPEILMIDELSLGLAPVLVLALFESLLRLKADGLTMLLVEQNVRMALTVSDYAYVLAEGRVAFEGPAREVAQNPEVRKAYLGI